MDFKSDNVAPVSEEIIEAIKQANYGNQPAYGNDEYTNKLRQKLAEIFEREVEIFLCSTGTMANSLSLNAICPPYGAIYASDISHINNDECGAHYLFTGGSSIVTFPHSGGKLKPEYLVDKIEGSLALRPHNNKPSAISITQATEVGTIYKLDEIAAIKALADKYKLKIHMDGARFTNALVTLGVTPAELSWKAGIDVLCLGATKNGALAGEIVIFFNKDLANEFDYIHKRAGQLFSKMRYFSSQLLAYFDNDLWMLNANLANKAASNLASALKKVEQIKILYPVEANEIFVSMPANIANSLMSKGALFYEWEKPGSQIYRFVTSFATKDEEIANFINHLKSYTNPIG